MLCLFRYQTSEGSCTNWLVPVMPSDLVAPALSPCLHRSCLLLLWELIRVRWMRPWSLRCSVTLAKLLRLSEIVSLSVKWSIWGCTPHRWGLNELAHHQALSKQLINVVILITLRTHKAGDAFVGLASYLRLPPLFCSLLLRQWGLFLLAVGGETWLHSYTLGWFQSMVPVRLWPVHLDPMPPASFLSPSPHPPQGGQNWQLPSTENEIK